MVCSARPAAGDARRQEIERGPGDDGPRHLVLQNAPRDDERGGRGPALLALLLVVLMLTLFVLLEPTTQSADCENNYAAGTGECGTQNSLTTVGEMLYAGIVECGTQNSLATVGEMLNAGTGECGTQNPLTTVGKMLYAGTVECGTQNSLATVGEMLYADTGECGTLADAAGAAGDVECSQLPLGTDCTSVNPARLHAPFPRVETALTQRSTEGDFVGDHDHRADADAGAAGDALAMTDESAGDEESAGDVNAAESGDAETNAAVGSKDLEDAAAGSDDVLTACTPEPRAAAGTTTERTTTMTTIRATTTHGRLYPGLRRPTCTMTTTDVIATDLMAHPPALFDGCRGRTILLACAICAGCARRHSAAGDVRLEDRGWMGMRWRPVLRGAGAADDVGPGLRALRFVGSGLTGLIV